MGVAIKADRDCLLRAIIESPDDDAPRLAYADEVEASNPGHAAFIRAQIDRAREDRRESFRIEGRLASSAKDWLRLPEPFRVDRWTGVGGTITFGAEGGATARFRRGFAEAVAMQTSDFMAAAGELFAAHPVRQVDLVGRRPGEEYVRRKTGTNVLVYRWVRGLVARSGVPARLADCWPGGWDDGREYEKGWQARQDLEAAAVAFGRKAAGLEG